jgi:hypothetical protein
VEQLENQSFSGPAEGIFGVKFPTPGIVVDVLNSLLEVILVADDVLKVIAMPNLYSLHAEKLTSAPRDRRFERAYEVGNEPTMGLPKASAGVGVAGETAPCGGRFRMRMMPWK